MSTLKTLRVARGLTQMALAQQLGVDQSTICLWEKGKTFPRRDVAIRLANILGCTIADIYCAKQNTDMSVS